MDESHSADSIRHWSKPETAKRTPRATSTYEDNNAVGDCFGADHGMTCHDHLVAVMTCEGRAVCFRARRGRLHEPAQPRP
jgi:hypothetical protein